MEKQIQFLKSGVLKIAFVSASLFLVLAILLPACNDGKPEDTKKVAKEDNDAKFDNKKEDDAKFLVNAAEMNLEDIQLGILAQNNSMNAEIKSMGKMMETEHSKAFSDLQALAARKQITIPTSLTDDGQDANKKLMDKKGRDFDKEYCDMMVNGHKDAIKMFEKASSDATDPDIRNWATSMLPTLRTHLDRLITCQNQLDKM